MINKYQVSEKEIVRREKAFVALSTSVFMGSFLASKIFEVLIPNLFLIGFAFFLLLMNFWLKKFFDNYLKMETCLSKIFLIRGKSKFLLKNIQKIKIKRTTNKTIREIEILFNNQKSLFINGLSNFEKFEKNLLSKINNNTIVRNTSEPLDFDGVFFYPILGLLLSFGTVYFLKLMTTFSDQMMKVTFYVSIIYILLVAGYFLLSKPISKRY